MNREIREPREGKPGWWDSRNGQAGFSRTSGAAGGEQEHRLHALREPRPQSFFAWFAYFAVTILGFLVGVSDAGLYRLRNNEFPQELALLPEEVKDRPGGEIAKSNDYRQAPLWRQRDVGRIATGN